MRMSAGSLAPARTASNTTESTRAPFRKARVLQNSFIICRCEMATGRRSEHDAAESAKRAGVAKYGDSLLLYCFSRVVKTQSPQHFVALLLEHRLVTCY